MCVSFPYHTQCLCHVFETYFVSQFSTINWSYMYMMIRFPQYTQSQILVHRILKTHWFHPYNFFMKKWWFKKNQFRSFWHDTLSTHPRGNLLKVYISIYIFFLFFTFLLYNSLPRWMVDRVSCLKDLNWFFFGIIIFS